MIKRIKHEYHKQLEYLFLWNDACSIDMTASNVCAMILEQSNYLNSPKWFQMLQSNGNSFICTQLYSFKLGHWPNELRARLWSGRSWFNPRLSHIKDEKNRI